MIDEVDDRRGDGQDDHHDNDDDAGGEHEVAGAIDGAEGPVATEDAAYFFEEFHFVVSFQFKGFNIE